MPLTARQEEVLRLSVLMTDKEIARELSISPKTVEKHIAAALAKLGATNRKAALRALGGNPPGAPPPILNHSVTGVLSGVDEPIPPRADRGDHDWRDGPYVLLGLPRAPPRLGPGRLWLILGRAVIWLGLLGLLVSVIGAFLTLVERFDVPPN